MHFSNKNLMSNNSTYLDVRDRAGAQMIVYPDIDQHLYNKNNIIKYPLIRKLSGSMMPF